MIKDSSLVMTIGVLELTLRASHQRHTGQSIPVLLFVAYCTSCSPSAPPAS
jgi:ABC-type amino acid transport system permease subunit